MANESTGTAGGFLHRLNQKQKVIFGVASALIIVAIAVVAYLGISGRLKIGADVTSMAQTIGTNDVLACKSVNFQDCTKINQSTPDFAPLNLNDAVRSVAVGANIANASFCMDGNYKSQCYPVPAGYTNADLKSTTGGTTNYPVDSKLGYQPFKLTVASSLWMSDKGRLVGDTLTRQAGPYVLPGHSTADGATKCQPGDNQIALYKAANYSYSSGCAVFNVSSYPVYTAYRSCERDNTGLACAGLLPGMAYSYGSMDYPDYKIGSVKVGKNAKATLYTSKDYAGTAREITESVANLSSFNLGSLRVEGKEGFLTITPESQTLTAATKFEGATAYKAIGVVPGADMTKYRLGTTTKRPESYASLNGGTLVSAIGFANYLASATNVKTDIVGTTGTNGAYGFITLKLYNQSGAVVSERSVKLNVTGTAPTTSTTSQAQCKLTANPTSVSMKVGEVKEITVTATNPGNVNDIAFLSRVAVNGREYAEELGEIDNNSFVKVNYSATASNGVKKYKLTAQKNTGTNTVKFNVATLQNVCTRVELPVTVSDAVVPPPVITSFTAEKSPIPAGTSTKLTSVYTGGTGVLISGTQTLGAMASGVVVSTGNLSANKTYTLKVTNSVGVSVTKDLTVEVISPIEIEAFTATPSTLGPNGGNSTLQWTLKNASGATCTINGSSTGVSANEGSGNTKAVSLTTTTVYGLACTKNSVTDNASVTVTVPTIQIDGNLVANPASLPFGGGSSTLSYKLINVPTGATCTISNGSSNLTGVTANEGQNTKVVNNITASTTFALNCTGAGQSTGPKTATVMVASGAQITSFTADPAQVPTGGGNSTLSWTLSGETSTTKCVIDQNVGDVSKDADKKVVVPVNVDTTYKLTCDGNSKTVTVTVAPVACKITISNFKANPVSLALGETSSLTWATSLTGTGCGNDTVTCTVNGAAATSPISVKPAVAGDNVYGLVCSSQHSASVNASAKVTVTGKSPCGTNQVAYPVVTNKWWVKTLNTVPPTGKTLAQIMGNANLTYFFNGFGNPYGKGDLAQGTDYLGLGYWLNKKANDGKDYICINSNGTVGKSVTKALPHQALNMIGTPLAAAINPHKQMKFRFSSVANKTYTLDEAFASGYVKAFFIWDGSKYLPYTNLTRYPNFAKYGYQSYTKIPEAMQTTDGAWISTRSTEKVTLVVE